MAGAWHVGPGRRGPSRHVREPVIHLAASGVRWRAEKTRDTGIHAGADHTRPAVGPASKVSAQMSNPVEDSGIEITAPDVTCVRVDADVGLAHIRRIIGAVCQ